jgi:uncharacterized protein (TIGR02058 family)
VGKKRFIVEIGTGIDLHGADVTEAACRAVKDAISSSCLCGLVEILSLKDPGEVDIEVVVACPRPDQVDLERVKQMLPIGRKSARAAEGGILAGGLCIDRFGQDCADIVVANAAVTVYVVA